MSSIESTSVLSIQNLICFQMNKYLKIILIPLELKKCVCHIGHGPNLEKGIFFVFVATFWRQGEYT